MDLKRQKMPQKARKKMQNNNVVARIKSGEVPEQKFEGECLLGIILKETDEEGNRNSDAILIGRAGPEMIVQGLAAEVTHIIQHISFGDKVFEALLLHMFREEMKLAMVGKTVQKRECIDYLKGEYHE